MLRNVMLANTISDFFQIIITYTYNTKYIQIFA